MLGDQGDPPSTSVPSALLAVLKIQILLGCPVASKPPAQLRAAAVFFADVPVSTVRAWKHRSLPPLCHLATTKMTSQLWQNHCLASDSLLVLAKFMVLRV